MPEDSKDRIINLRVSRTLYERIAGQAKANRETVSNFIRKAIEDSTGLFAELSGGIFGEALRFKDIMGYHEIHAARQFACDACGRNVVVGEKATIGETAGSKKYFFCPSCPQA